MLTVSARPYQRGSTPARRVAGPYTTNPTSMPNVPGSDIHSRAELPASKTTAPRTRATSAARAT
jgi:hypothetical protein